MTGGPTPILAPKLTRGDQVRVIAPSRSRAMVLEHDHRSIIDERFAQLGLTLSYGSHVDERDPFDSASIASRVDDLHAAFADPEVAAVLTVIGGFNSNELLPYLDWELIGANPKVFCGYSDITALHGAILAKTGLITYSGPHWSSFGMRDHFTQTLDWFSRTLLANDPVRLEPARSWTDDLWFLDQDDRVARPGDGWWAMRPGAATGTVLGTNLCTLNLLQGTGYLPSLAGAVLMIEDDSRSDPPTFARDLTSLLQLPDAGTIRGLAIGRFQVDSGMTRPLLEAIVERQPVLNGLPVLANVDFGHTFPLATLPIGGTVELTVGERSSVLLSG